MPSTLTTAAAPGTRPGSYSAAAAAAATVRKGCHQTSSSRVVVAAMAEVKVVAQSFAAHRA